MNDVYCKKVIYKFNGMLIKSRAFHKEECYYKNFFLADKGTPVERQARKAKGLKRLKSYDSRAAETGINVSTLLVPL